MRSALSWYTLLEEHKTQWEKFLAKIDEDVRNIYFEENKLPDDMIILAAYFHAHYMATYMSRVIDERPEDFPREMIDAILAEAKNFGDSSAGLLFSKFEEKDVNYYEPVINMKGGDA